MASQLFSSLLFLWPLSSCYCSGGDYWCFSATPVAIASCAALDQQACGSVHTDRSAFAAESWLLLCLPFCYLAVTAALLCLLLLTLILAQPPQLEVDMATQEAFTCVWFCNGRGVVSQPSNQTPCSYSQKMGVCTSPSKPGIEMKVCFTPIASMSF